MTAFGLWAALAAAGSLSEREVALCQSLFEAGKFSEAQVRAQGALSQLSLSEPQRVSLYTLVGLSFFNLGDVRSAEASFLASLKVNPDHVLDPFSIPPGALKLFETVRRNNAEVLNMIRQQIALKLEQDRRDIEAKEKLRASEEESLRKAASLTQNITVRTIEKQPFLMNLLPFGAGQFSQGRTPWGLIFAITEAVAVATSVASFWIIESMYETKSYLVEGRIGGPVTITTRRIPESRQAEYEILSATKFTSGISFFGLWIIGATEAIIRQPPDVVTEQTKPKATITLGPLQGGATAHFLVTF
jgi:tetratricopeptide (TPR) repeat protein